MIIKLYEYEVPFNQYSDYIYILILFKLNYIPYKIHKCVDFKIWIEKVLRREYFNFKFALNFWKRLKITKNIKILTLKNLWLMV